VSMSGLLPQRDMGSVATMLWTSPESNLWVADSDGEYAGLVEFRDGHFVARNRTDTALGVFSDIPSAKSAVTAAAHEKRTLLTLLASGTHTDTPPVAPHRLTRHYRRNA